MNMFVQGFFRARKTKLDEDSALFEAISSLLSCSVNEELVVQLAKAVSNSKLRPLLCNETEQPNLFTIIAA